MKSAQRVLVAMSSWSPPSWSPRRLQMTVWAAIALPFVITAIALATKDYHPVLDLAMTELRVRDVGGADTPLIGLPGRIGVFPDQGSHPGPLSFYLLAPTYRLAGSSAWGLLAGTIVLDLVAIALALWLAHRRGGAWLTVAVGALIIVLVRGYGLEVLSQPWNPYLPLLFWLVVLLGTWSVVAGDHSLIVVVAAVGSLCAQTHMPYLGLSLGMGALCVAAVVTHWVKHPAARNELKRHLGIAALVGVVLWSPPVVDQLRRSPGNLSMLNEYFRTPPESPVGAFEGVRLMLRHLDLFRLTRRAFGGDGFITRAAFDLEGSVLPGLIVVVAWLAGAVFAWRRRHRLLNSLNIVVGWAMVLGAASMGRIFGKVWYYLTLWAWTTAALAAVSALWAATIAIRDSARVDLRSVHRGRLRHVIPAALAVFGLGSYVALLAEAAGTPVPEQHLSDTLAELVDPTTEAMDAGVGGADGRAGRYVVTWNDASNFGSQGYGLVSELERRGFDVGVPDTWRVPVTLHRVIEPTSATAEVRLATGFYIEQVRALPGATEVIVYEPRDTGELAEYAKLEAEVAAALRAAGLDDLVELLTTNLFGLQLDPRVSVEVQRKVDRMLQLGTATAVFILPPGSER